MTDGDIHNQKGRIENTINRIKGSEKSTQLNRDLIFEFQDYLNAEGLSKDRISRYLYTWFQLLDHVDFSLDEPEKDDLIELVGKINQDQVRDRELSEQTKMEYKKAVKKFYAHFLQSKLDNFNGKKLCDFFTLTTNSKKVDPDQLPHPNTVKSLVKQARTIRDKAFIVTLWSTAGRVGEIMGLKWKDIIFNSDIAKVKFRETKTGGDRVVPIHVGYVYLKQLKETDPKSDKPEEFLFRSHREDKQLSYTGASNIIDRARKKADIPERIKTNPHAFRKGRTTYLASKGMNQAQLCKFGGWAQGSPVVGKYIRMAEEDVEAGMREIAGLQKNDSEPEEDLNPVRCHKCGTMNKFENLNCLNCGATLTTSEKFKEVQIDEAKDKLKNEMIKNKMGIGDDKIEEKARELIKSEMGLD